MLRIQIFKYSPSEISRHDSGFGVQKIEAIRNEVGLPRRRLFAARLGFEFVPLLTSMGKPSLDSHNFRGPIFLSN